MGQVIFSGLVALFFIVGCVTNGSQQKIPDQKDESPQDVESAVGAVTDAIRKRNIAARYCPTCGRHFSGHLETCPQDKSQLKEVEH